MRFNCDARGEKCLVDVEMANSSVTIESGAPGPVKISQYHVANIEAGDLNWSNLQRAERIAELAVDHYSSTGPIDDKVQKITFTPEIASHRGKLILVG